MPTLQDQLQQLNLLNETKGQETAVLFQLPAFRQQAETEQDWAMVAHSYWTEHLAHQHLVMNGQDPDNTHRLAMESTALAAHQVVTSRALDSLLGSSHRFLGRANTYNGRHEAALTEYQTAAEILKKDQDPRYLEVTGFICESLVRTGQVAVGLDLAYHTFDDYDVNPLATKLKMMDEYTYNVWRTGIFPRLLAALLELKVPFDRELAKLYLQKSLALLTDSEKYAYRIGEITQALSLLG